MPEANRKNVDLEGQDLGNYHGLCKIGAGPMGTVYRARDVSMGIDVALKVLLPHLAADEAFMDHLQGEAESATQLRKHPNIAAVYRVGRERDVGYIATEYAPGHTLDQTIGDKGGLELPRVVALFDQLASALDYAHEQGLIHGDVNPRNVIVSHEDHVKLTDFGIAKALEDEAAVTGIGGRSGDPRYSSPEQVLFQRVTHLTDIYSLGILLYQTLTGTVPFETLYRQAHEKPVAPSSLKSDIPEAVDRVILKALQKKPNDRYQSAGEMAAELRRASEESEPEEPDGNGPWEELQKRGPALIVVLAALLGLALLWGVSQALRGCVPPTVTPLPAHTPSPTVTASVAVSPTPTRTATSSSADTPPTSTPTMPPSPTMTPSASHTPRQMITPLVKMYRGRDGPAGVGDVGYQKLDITGASYSGGKLRLYGAIIMPKKRYPDQVWQVWLVGDDVVGGEGLDPEDSQVKKSWWSATGHRQDDATLLAEFPTSDNLRCVIWVKLVAGAGTATEKVYAKFDLQEIFARCVR